MGKASSRFSSIVKDKISSLTCVEITAEFNKNKLSLFLLNLYKLSDILANLSPKKEENQLYTMTLSHKTFWSIVKREVLNYQTLDSAN